MNSPWGLSQQQKTLVKGVVSVSTAGHGGIMVLSTAADQLMSKEAISRGEVFYTDRNTKKWYCYEEDCAYAIPLYEIKQAWEKAYSHNDKTEQEIEQGLLSTLSRWYADYLLSIGVTPLGEQYQYFLDDKKDEEMRKNKDPDLIVAAWGDWKTNISGVFQVVTADGKYHHVTGESYDKRTERGRLNLLSNCEIVARDIKISA
jgi:hypothetical protein